MYKPSATRWGPKEGGLNIGQPGGLNMSRIESKRTIKPVITYDLHSLGPPSFPLESRRLAAALPLQGDEPHISIYIYIYIYTHI